MAKRRKAPKKDLKAIALKVYDRSVFTDRQVLDASMLPMVFLPLAFMTKKQMADFLKLKPALIFEDVSKAGRYVNGMPTFTSCQTLTKEELDETRRHLQEIVEWHRKQ